MIIGDENDNAKVYAGHADVPLSVIINQWDSMDNSRRYLFRKNTHEPMRRKDAFLTVQSTRAIHRGTVGTGNR
ncbi:hypothetical protein [Desulfosporosinus lacus]|uniref:Uncharacterized protein n=1 Tax=Desulfosporosinus lacus DSM 15449 TaxID=1121420 RepID=A0A1M5V5W7_9FIRM|nr:hypothetical protein [Desulfosporosinus lacus]SHH70639.1 hypothetical protein SAMN02746098_01213 [Desulfosporosinus lacus DSM 15449]